MTNMSRRRFLSSVLAAVLGTGLSSKLVQATPTTPHRMIKLALAIAELLVGLPEAQQRKALQDLAKLDPGLHATVVNLLHSLRSIAQYRTELQAALAS